MLKGESGLGNVELPGAAARLCARRSVATGSTWGLLALTGDAACIDDGRMGEDAPLLTPGGTGLPAVLPGGNTLRLGGRDDDGLLT